MTTKISGDNISAIANTGVNWNAVTVADGSTTVNASAGNGYILDTNTGVIEVFLPTSPTRGDTVVLTDYSGTFATNNVIVNTGGVAIDSTVGSDFILSTNNRIAEFVYVDSNKGWLYKGATVKGSTPSQIGAPVYDSDLEYISATGGTVTESGNDKIHTFTGDGCFVVSCVGNPAGSNTVEYLVIAGGGGAGGSSGNNSAGGGGAGGYRTNHTNCTPSPGSAGIPVSVTTYPVTVGGGGAGGCGNCGIVSPTQVGISGSNSVFSTITSAGGAYGGGGAPSGQAPITNGGDGGSGGGGGGGNAGTPTCGGIGGTGNTPPVSPPQGNDGGLGGNNPLFPPGPDQRGGGGGGASAGGENAPSSPLSSGDGGAGLSSDISGSSVGRAGGGAGAFAPPHTSPATASDGGGGQGSAGTVNTGGGGGGSCASGGNGNAGGKGIVIIRYKFQN